MLLFIGVFHYKLTGKRLLFAFSDIPAPSVITDATDSSSQGSSSQTSTITWIVRLLQEA